MKRPEPTSRHPLIVFLMILCVITGLRILLGEPAPSSIESELYAWQVNVWGTGCLLGALAFLVGIYLQPEDGAPNVATGIVLEQLGVGILTAACGIYAICIVATAGVDSILLAGIVTVFALACALRWWSIQRHVGRVKRDADQLGAVADGSL